MREWDTHEVVGMKPNCKFNLSLEGIAASCHFRNLCVPKNKTKILEDVMKVECNESQFELKIKRFCQDYMP
jgi:hypothetical protein